MRSIIRSFCSQGQNKQFKGGLIRMQGQQNQQRDQDRLRQFVNLNQSQQQQLDQSAAALQNNTSTPIALDLDSIERQLVDGHIFDPDDAPGYPIPSRSIEGGPGIDQQRRRGKKKKKKSGNRNQSTALGQPANRYKGINDASADLRETALRAGSSIGNPLQTSSESLGLRYGTSVDTLKVPYGKQSTFKRIRTGVDQDKPVMTRLPTHQQFEESAKQQLSIASVNSSGVHRQQPVPQNQPNSGKQAFSGKGQKKPANGVNMDYLSESDPEDNVGRVPLRNLSRADKEVHILRLWRTCYNFSLGAAALVAQSNALRTKIRLFGRQLVAQQSNHQLKMQYRPGWFIIMPDSKLKTFWNITVILLLAYTSTVVPFQVAFVDVDSDFAIFFNNMVDILFGVDIIINFFSAYETRNQKTEARLKRIAYTYITGWFPFDLLATFPTQLVLESGQNSSGVNKLARLARIPRLYRLFRVLRIFKIFKLFKYNKKFQQWFGYLNLGASATKMLKLAMVGLFLIHLFSCFWYLTAKLDDFNDDTWVVRRDLVYDDTFFVYFESIYWCVQVLTTVGYGDFGAATTAEYIMNLIWMLVGVGYYQIFFGQIVSVITAHATNASMLENKLKSLEDFCKETKLYEQDEELQSQIRQFLINNYLELNAKIDEEALLAELPLVLKEEVLYRQFGVLVETIKFLRESTDNEFVWAVVQIATKIAFEKDDTIYMQGDFSENIYMVFRGKVSLYAQNGYIFQSYGEGDLLGDSDSFLEEVRDSKAIASVNSIFYAVTMDKLEEVFAQHPEQQALMMRNAVRKNARHKKKIAAIEKRFPVYGIIKPELDAAGKLRLGSLLNQDEEGHNRHSDPEYTVMLTFLDELDEKLEQQPDLEEKKITEIYEFIQRRAMKSSKVHMTGDGEFSRDIAQLLQQKKSAEVNQDKSNFDDLKREIKNLKNYYAIMADAQADDQDQASRDKALQQDLPPDAGNFIVQPFGSNKSPHDVYKKAMTSIQDQSPSKTATPSTAAIRTKNHRQALDTVRDEVRKLAEYQKIVERDDRLGVPEAQAALEVVHHFNDDMQRIQGNMSELLSLMEQMGGQAQEQQQQMWGLEGQIISHMDKQQQVDKACESLMTKIGV